MIGELVRSEIEYWWHKVTFRPICRQCHLRHPAHKMGCSQREHN